LTGQRGQRKSGLNEENEKADISGRDEIHARLPDGLLCNSHRVFFAPALTEIAASRAPRETSNSHRRLFVFPSLRVHCRSLPFHFPSVNLPLLFRFGGQL